MKRILSWLLISLILITSLPLSPATFAETPEIDLIISEYVEGSSYNKAIEIYNGSDHAIDLSAYSIGKDVNGKLVDDKETFKPVQLSGIIEADSTFVVKCKNVKNTIPVSGLEITDFSFNGDDQIALFKGDVEIDRVGVPGDVSFGIDKTFVRNSNVIVGTVGPNDPRNTDQWTQYKKDDFTHLGSHVSVLNKGVKAVTSNAASGSELTKGSLIELSTETIGASIKVAMKTGDVYGDYTDYAPIEVNEAITFKAKAIKDDLESEETEFTYTVLTDLTVVTIADAKAAYVDVLPEKPDYLDDNGKVLIEGTVTALTEEYIYIQDAEHGIGVKVSGVNPSIGDKVSIYGQLGSSYSFMYLNVEASADFNILSSGNEVEAVAVTLDQINDDVEGQLVTLSNVTVQSINEYGEAVIKNAPENTILKPGEKTWLEAGQTYESYTGVVYYGYKKFQVLTRDEYDIVLDSNRVRNVTCSVESGMVSKNMPVELNTLTKGAKIYYTTDGSTPDESSQLYTTPIVVTEDITVNAVAIKDGLANSQVLSRNYIVNTSVGAKTISEIQGESHISPYVSKTVENVEGVVTALISYKFGDKTITGFYMQGPSDNNDQTSDAILVYSSKTVVIGNTVTVTGTVIEQVKEDDFYAYDQENQLSVTTLQNTTVTIKSSDISEVTPVILGQSGRIVPHDNISSDNFETYDASLYAIDFYESLEGMLVTMLNPVVVGAQVNRVVTVVPDNAAVAKADGDFNSEGGIVLRENDVNTEKLPINSAIVSNAISHLKTVKMGELLDGSVKGVLDYEWGSYMIYLTEQAPAVKENKANDDTFKYAINEDELRIGSFNVYNHGGKDKADKTAGIAAQIVNGMQSPDIIGLVEVQDNDSADNTSVTDASVTYQLFIDEIIKLGGPVYQWTDIEPMEDQEGGEPGGNIRVGYLYNPARVTLKAATKGGSSEAVSVDDQGNLTLNPGRINPLAPAFDGTRKSLAAQFVFNGEDVIVIANHLKSKGGDNSVYGNVQTPVLHSEAKRVEQAQIVNDFIDSLVAVDSNAKVVVLGDFNDYQFSNPIKALEGPDTVVNDMINTLPISEQFTYMYGGNAQVLDHILVTDNLVNDTKIDVININSILSKTDDTRFSDHDPVVVAIGGFRTDIVAPVTASQVGEVVKGTKITLTSDDVIYYSFGTLDLDDLTKNIKYSGEIAITEDATIQAIALKGDKVSEVSTFSYTLVAPKLTATPVGEVTKGTEVTLTSELEDATIYYSTSTFNTEDITKNKEYKNAIKINENTTITAIAVKDDIQSDITTFNYTVVSAITVAEAKALQEDQEVCLEVVITSTPGFAGSKGFTFQDKTGAGYVYTKNLDEEFVEGSHVLLKGTTTEYRNLFQINMTSMELLSTVELPNAKHIQITDIGETYESQLVMLKNLRVGNLSEDSYGNSIITCVSGKDLVAIKLDSRSGYTAEQVLSNIILDDMINVTGVILQKDDTYTFTLRSPEDIIVTSERSRLSALKTYNLNFEESATFKTSDFIITEVTGSLANRTGLVIFKLEKDGKPYRIGFSKAEQNGQFGTGFDTTGIPAGSYMLTAYFWSDLVLMNPLATPVYTSIEIE